MTLLPDAPIVHGPFVLRFSRHLSRLFLMGGRCARSVSGALLSAFGSLVPEQASLPSAVKHLPPLFIGSKSGPTAPPIVTENHRPTERQRQAADPST